MPGDNFCGDQTNEPLSVADMARKKCALSTIAKKYVLDLTLTDVRMAGDGLAGKPSNATQGVGFAVAVRAQNVDASSAKAGDDLTPTERTYLTEIAKEYAASQQVTPATQDISMPLRADSMQSKGRRLLIVAHTDDIGDSRFNANFSERRALAVAKIFNQAGIADNKIYFQGAGEVLPVADNRLPEGRRKNRRIEIMDLSDGIVLRQYLAARNARFDFYRINSASPLAVAGTGVSAAGNANASGPGRKKTVPVSSRKTSFDLGGVAPNAAIAGPDIGHSYPSSQQPVASATVTTSAATTTPATTVAVAATPPADSPLAHSCRDDRPRVANGIKALHDGKEIATAEFMPGLFSTGWSDTVHGHLIALTRVAVSRDDGAPVSKPQLQLYKNYRSGKSRPDLNLTPEVNVYRGDKALLYRVFINGPLRCMDIVIPNSNPATTVSAKLYYDSGVRPLVIDFNPQLME